MLTFKQLAVLTASAVLSLAALAADAGDEAGAWEKFKAFTHQQKSQAVAQGKQLIAETDQKIEALKKEGRQSSAEAKAAHAANMKDLQAKKQQAQAALAKMEKASGKVWDATKEGFSSAYKDLGAAYDKALAEVKQ